MKDIKEKKPAKIHHCFNCGAETENREELPNGHGIYICDESECQKEHNEQCRAMEAEARDNAREDGYSKYY